MLMFGTLEIRESKTFVSDMDLNEENVMDDQDNEQQNEYFMLQSIYFDTFKTFAEEPFYKFSITVTYQDWKHSPLPESPSLGLVFEYTKKYPVELPNIEFINVHHIPKRLLDELNDELIKTAEKNLGTVFIYSLVCTAQDMINKYVDKVKDLPGTATGEEADVNKMDEETLSNIHFGGTPVTKESFARWKERFDAERKIEEVPQVSDNKPKRLTGKDLFLRDVLLNTSDLSFLETGVENVDINAGLFEEEKSGEDSLEETAGSKISGDKSDTDED